MWRTDTHTHIQCVNNMDRLWLLVTNDVIISKRSSLNIITISVGVSWDSCQSSPTLQLTGGKEKTWSGSCSEFSFFFIPVTCFHFIYAMSGCESHAAASLVFQPSTQTALWIPEHVTTEGTPSGGSPGDANVFFFCFFLVSGRHTNDRAETQ